MAAEEGAKASGASSTELADLKKENQDLKAKVAKQEYRIRHLIEGMEKMLLESKMNNMSLK
jgi:hypothetical protein